MPAALLLPRDSPIVAAGCEALGVFLILRPKTFPSIADGRRRGGRVCAGEGCSVHYRVAAVASLAGEASAAPPKGDIPLPRPRPAIAGPRAGKVAAQVVRPPRMPPRWRSRRERSATTTIPASGVLLRHGDAETSRAECHGKYSARPLQKSPPRAAKPAAGDGSHVRHHFAARSRCRQTGDRSRAKGPARRGDQRRGQESTIRSRASSLNG